MKAYNYKYLNIFSLAIMMILQIGTAIGQEEEKKNFEKVDFLVTTTQTDLVDDRGDILVNLKLDILSEGITDLDKVYVKVTTIEPREVYFIRAINKNVLSGAKDVNQWEKEIQKLEKDREKERIEKSKDKKYKEHKDLWSLPRYEKQDGKQLKVAQMEGRNTTLEFGPFSPGDYEVYVRAMDESKKRFIDTHKITISSEVEPKE